VVSREKAVSFVKLANPNPDDDWPKELVRLCRTGRLYELEMWILDGKPLDISGARKRGRQKSLLEIAVETGFHSLVQLIANHESSRSSRDAALAQAVSSRRLDLVELLLANGADIKSVPLVDVLLTWEPKTIRFFLDHGADAVSDRPFAEAFGAKIRTSLRAYVEYRRAHPELAAQLQEQVDCALRHFCCEGELKWVSLLIWAGGDPRSRGPCLYKEYTEDAECYTSGIEEACHAETVDVLKKLRPDPSRVNLSDLLYSASISSRQPILHYLLEIGANPNDKPNGGSQALDTVLWHLDVAGINLHGSKGLKSGYVAWKELDSLRELLAHGAIWNPNEKYQVNSLRNALLGYEPELTIELLQMFRKYNACPAERVHLLLGTARMKEHMKPQEGALLRLGIHLDAAVPPKRRK
jgi:ankyrin repeat protein